MQNLSIPVVGHGIGGLSSTIARGQSGHPVSAIRYRHPCFPPEFQPAIARNQRHATIVVA